MIMQMLCLILLSPSWFLDSIRRLIGIDKQKPVRELRIARYDIEDDGPKKQETPPKPRYAGSQ